MKTIGANIKNLRQQKSLSMSKLAVKAGVSVECISRLEKNRIKNPGVKTIKSISAALEVSLAEVLKGTEFKT